MKILFTILLLLASSSDYDYIRAMRDHSTIEHQRWWIYRAGLGVPENEVAHQGAERPASTVGHKRRLS